MEQRGLYSYCYWWYLQCYALCLWLTACFSVWDTASPLESWPITAIIMTINCNNTCDGPICIIIIIDAVWLSFLICMCYIYIYSMSDYNTTCFHQSSSLYYWALHIVTYKLMLPILSAEWMLIMWIVSCAFTDSLTFVRFKEWRVNPNCFLKASNGILISLPRQANSAYMYRGEGGEEREGEKMGQA